MNFITAPLASSLIMLPWHRRPSSGSFFLGLLSSLPLSRCFLGFFCMILLLGQWRDVFVVLWLKGRTYRVGGYFFPGRGKHCLPSTIHIFRMYTLPFLNSFIRLPVLIFSIKPSLSPKITRFPALVRSAVLMSGVSTSATWIFSLHLCPFGGSKGNNLFAFVGNPVSACRFIAPASFRHGAGSNRTGEFTTLPHTGNGPAIDHSFDPFALSWRTRRTWRT